MTLSTVVSLDATLGLLGSSLFLWLISLGLVITSVLSLPYRLSERTDILHIFYTFFGSSCLNRKYALSLHASLLYNSNTSLHACVMRSYFQIKVNGGSQDTQLTIGTDSESGIAKTIPPISPSEVSQRPS